MTYRARLGMLRMLALARGRRDALVDNVRVGVVTVTYNSAKHLEGFFDSLLRQDDAGMRLYAIDNNSPDDSLALLDDAREAYTSRLDIRVIANPVNVGVAAANNQGIRAALSDGAEWVLILNNDTLFGEGFISELLDVATNASASLLAPVITNGDEPATLWYGGGRMVAWQGYRIVHDGMHVTPAAERLIAGLCEPTGYASTCCLLVHKDVFATVGLMDESYFVYADDTDFAIRCTEAGVPFHITSRVRLTHLDGGSTGGNLSKFSVTWLTRNWVLVARRYRTGWRLPIALGYIYLWSLGRFLLGRDKLPQLRWRMAAIRSGLSLDKNDHRVPTFLA